MRFSIISSLSIVAALLSPVLVQAETAYGYVRGAGGSRFISTFMVEGMVYNFSGNLNPAVEPFSSSNAELEYDDVRQLAGQAALRGTVGTEDIKLQFSNGIVVSGRLDYPVGQKSRVTGAGVWSQTRMPFRGCNRY